MMAGGLPFTVAAFLVALAVLIVVHEFGHFLVARLCGVKVLRFSVGFGKPLVVRTFGRDETEWAIGAFPLGGYVKMLDEAEAPVADHELHRAFNRQPVGKRFLIVLAGPVANLLLAILLYWALFLNGVHDLRPVLGQPPAASAAAAAGIQDGERVRSVNGTAVETWQQFRWEVLNLALKRDVANLEVESRDHTIATRRLDTSAASLADLEADLPAQLGLQLFRPRLKPIVGSVVPGSPAAAAGLVADDVIVAIDGAPTPSSGEVVAMVRQNVGKPLAVTIRRGAATLTLSLTPADVVDNGKRVPRIGVQFKDDPTARVEMTTIVHYGPLAALGKAFAQTWDTAAISLRVMGQMIAGSVSWRNLSGPVTIADYAGQSARLGIGPYLNFLAMISISLGVLNLLPIPILDGGHLLYYLAEIIKGKPLPDRVADIGRQIGFALLVMLMVFAFYNDINRLISG